MNLTFYHSPWCPRCRKAGRHLEELLGPEGAGSLHRVDIMRHPISSWRAGVRMIPALTFGSDHLSGLTLPRQRIEAFLDRHQLLNRKNEHP